MYEDPILTITQAGYLAGLIKGVEHGDNLEYYPLGTDSADRPLKVVLRAFTEEFGPLYPHDADIRNAYVWCSGTLEHWFKVSDLIRALENAVSGRFGLDQPLAMIRER